MCVGRARAHERTSGKIEFSLVRVLFARFLCVRERECCGVLCEWGGSSVYEYATSADSLFMWASVAGKLSPSGGRGRCPCALKPDIRAKQPTPLYAPKPETRRTNTDIWVGAMRRAPLTPQPVSFLRFCCCCCSSICSSFFLPCVCYHIFAATTTV